MSFALLIPCKNGAPHLPRLFASAADQVRAFDEVILFDDGSTDGSGDVARSFGAKVIRCESSIGPAAARNRLADASACEWLHFHDADDTMQPDFLSATAAVANDSSADLIVCAMRWINEQSGAVEAIWQYDEPLLRTEPLQHLIRCTIGGINGTYRKAAFSMYGGFDPSRDYWEDLEFAARWLRGGARVRVLVDELVTAFRRVNSYSNSNLSRVWRSKCELLESWLPTCTSAEREVIANEAEIIAVRLLRLRDYAGVREALGLNWAAGGDAPHTSNPFLRASKAVLPPCLVLQLQDVWRRKLSGNQSS